MCSGNVGMWVWECGVGTGVRYGLWGVFSGKVGCRNPNLRSILRLGTWEEFWDLELEISEIRRTISWCEDDFCKFLADNS